MQLISYRSLIFLYLQMKTSYNMGEASFTISLKLLVDKKAKKVLFAEAGKDAVDFLCSILTLPLATITRLLSEQGMVGCLSNLYQSIENLNDDYLQLNQHKDAVLKPMVQVSTESTPSFFLTDDDDAPKKKGYRCGYSYDHNYVAYNPGSICPACNRIMNTEMTVVAGAVAAAGGGRGSGGGGGGFVKGVVTYMVMDDLVVKPMSTITGITLLNKFNVSDVGALEEKVVDLDMAKALKLLKTSLHSKNVLTAVFL